MCVFLGGSGAAGRLCPGAVRSPAQHGRPLLGGEAAAAADVGSSRDQHPHLRAGRPTRQGEGRPTAQTVLGTVLTGRKRNVNVSKA